jgi:hypothetical protein
VGQKDVFEAIYRNRLKSSSRRVTIKNRNAAKRDENSQPINKKGRKQYENKRFLL